jgi:magnesium transporter
VVVEEYVDEPWAELGQLCRESDRASVATFLEALPPPERARVLSRLPADERRIALNALSPSQAADILEAVSRAQATELVEVLEPGEAAGIVDEMGSAAQADLLAELAPTDAESILRAMDPKGARAARELLTYPPETAGGLMRKEFVTFREDATVGDVIEDLRVHGERYARYAIQYGFVTSRSGALVGVLGLRGLLFAPKSDPVTQVMIREPHTVGPACTLDELGSFFDRHTYLGVPVVDHHHRLLGVVDRRAVQEARGERIEDAFLKRSGIVGGEEIRTLPLHVRSRRRLSWLSLNIVLNVISASVIAFYEETLQSVIALAVFLPIISDMSGCSGNQAVTVSIRELSLGLVKPREIGRVLAKEASLGVINGLALGTFLGGLAWVWKGNPWLGLVVGGALTLNTIVSVTLGGCLPLLLQRFGRDPALAAAPILTTVTDLLGFLSALTFATLLLSRLTG